MTDKNKLLLHITVESLVVAGVIVYFQNKTNKLEKSISEYNHHITSLNEQYQSVVAKLESQHKEITAMKTTMDTQKATIDKLTYLITDLDKDTSVNRLCQGISLARSLDQRPQLVHSIDQLPPPVHIPNQQPLPPQPVRNFDQQLPPPVHIPDQQPLPPPVHIPNQQPLPQPVHIPNQQQPLPQPVHIPDQQPQPPPVHIPDQQPLPVLTPDFKPQLPTILEGKESGGYDSLDEELEEEFNLLVKEEKDNIHKL